MKAQGSGVAARQGVEAAVLKGIRTYEGPAGRAGPTLAELVTHLSQIPDFADRSHHSLWVAVKQTIRNLVSNSRVDRISRKGLNSGCYFVLTNCCENEAYFGLQSSLPQTSSNKTNNQDYNFESASSIGDIDIRPPDHLSKTPPSLLHLGPPSLFRNLPDFSVPPPRFMGPNPAAEGFRVQNGHESGGYLRLRSPLIGTCPEMPTGDNVASKTATGAANTVSQDQQQSKPSEPQPFMFSRVIRSESSLAPPDFLPKSVSQARAKQYKDAAKLSRKFMLSRTPRQSRAGPVAKRKIMKKPDSGSRPSSEQQPSGTVTEETVTPAPCKKQKVQVVQQEADSTSNLPQPGPSSSSGKLDAKRIENFLKSNSTASNIASKKLLQSRLKKFVRNRTSSGIGEEFLPVPSSPGGTGQMRPVTVLMVANSGGGGSECATTSEHLLHARRDAASLPDVRCTMSDVATSDRGTEESSSCSNVEGRMEIEPALQQVSSSAPDSEPVLRQLSDPLLSELRPENLFHQSGAGMGLNNLFSVSEAVQAQIRKAIAPDLHSSGATDKPTVQRSTTHNVNPHSAVNGKLPISKTPAPFVPPVKTFNNNNNPSSTAVRRRRILPKPMPTVAKHVSGDVLPPTVSPKKSELVEIEDDRKSPELPMANGGGEASDFATNNDAPFEKDRGYEGGGATCSDVRNPSTPVAVNNGAIPPVYRMRETAATQYGGSHLSPTTLQQETDKEPGSSGPTLEKTTDTTPTRSESLPVPTVPSQREEISPLSHGEQCSSSEELADFQFSTLLREAATLSSLPQSDGTLSNQAVPSAPNPSNDVPKTNSDDKCDLPENRQEALERLWQVCQKEEDLKKQVDSLGNLRSKLQEALDSVTKEYEQSKVDLAEVTVERKALLLAPALTNTTRQLSGREETAFAAVTSDIRQVTSERTAPTVPNGSALNHGSPSRAMGCREDNRAMWTRPGVKCGDIVRTRLRSGKVLQLPHNSCLHQSSRKRSNEAEQRPLVDSDSRSIMNDESSVGAFQTSRGDSGSLMPEAGKCKEEPLEADDSTTQYCEVVRSTAPRSRKQRGGGNFGEMPGNSGDDIQSAITVKMEEPEPITVMDNGNCEDSRSDSNLQGTSLGFFESSGQCQENTGKTGGNELSPVLISPTGIARQPTGLPGIQVRYLCALSVEDAAQRFGIHAPPQ